MLYRWFVILGFFASLLVAGVASAQTGSMGASVITPMTLAEAAPLEFGQPDSPANPGTWSVQGEPSTAYSIALPEGDVTLLSGSDAMTVTDFTDSQGGSSATDASGNDSFSVDATLDGPTPVDGAYSGSYEVTIAYQ